MRRASHDFVTAVVPAAAAGQLISFAMPYDLVRSVTEELRWDPRIDAGRIAVSADGSTVTLTGVVQSYSVKCCAEKSRERFAASSM
jgi:osmotically-inducible protein OsmY